MEVFYRIEVNLVTFLILAVVFVIGYKNLDKSDSLNRAFLVTVLGVILGLLAEAASCVINGDSYPFAIVVNNILSVIIFAVAPMISFYFFIFIFHLVLPNTQLNRNLWFIFALPVITNVILSILSPFLGFFFSVSAEGIYSRGPLFPLSAVSTYLFMAAGVVLVLFNYHRMIKRDFWLILGIGIIPILGGIAQGLVYGILAMWSSAAVALFLGYLFLQDRMIRLDSLTGAWNRESFYFIYSRRLQQTPDKKFGAIFLDIDNLKLINDTFGHLEGDKAIKLVMETIRSVLPPGAVICRFGGDEFIVLYDCDTMTQINTILRDIKKGFSESEEVKAKDYPLGCSFGTALYTTEFTDLNAFLSRLDSLMYKDKFSKNKTQN